MPTIASGGIEVKTISFAVADKGASGRDLDGLEAQAIWLRRWAMAFGRQSLGQSGPPQGPDRGKRYLRRREHPPFRQDVRHVIVAS